MGPGAEPGFHPGVFLIFFAIGLVQPFSIIIGVAAGFLLTRWWLALVVALAVAIGLQWWLIRPLSGDGIVFLAAFSLPAGVWAGVVQAGRSVVRSHGDLL